MDGGYAKYPGHVPLAVGDATLTTSVGIAYRF